ncbi:MAG TPA: DUF3151 family protein [Actinomycetes bacterium]|jgi:hypothetical protein
MSQLPISEPGETRISEPEGSLEAVAGAASLEDLAELAGRYPACLAAWAALGEAALAVGRTVDAYAYFRVGYHRGLDRIRKAGWRGSGRVPWAHEPNRGFLRALRGLQLSADALGERDEAERCQAFLRELAPDAPDLALPHSPAP